MGIRYEHVPASGIPTAERKQVRRAEDRVQLLQCYSGETLVREQPVLKRIAGSIEERAARWALTCFEANAAECHRHFVAEALDALGVGPAVHL